MVDVESVVHRPPSRGCPAVGPLARFEAVSREGSLMLVRRTTAAVLAAGLLLAGCSDDPEPRFEPTESPSPTETSSSAAPEAQSPEEFIREWFELNTEMQNTGETEAFLALSRGCKTCKELASRIEGIYAAGGNVAIAYQKVQSVDARGGEEFSVMVNAAPTVFSETADSPEDRLKGGPNEFIMRITRDGKAWRMIDYLDTPS
jgi:hypothetical protein